MGIAAIPQLLIISRACSASKPSGRTDKSDSLPSASATTNDTVILTTRVADMLREVNRLIARHKDLEMQIKLLEGMKYGGIVIAIAGLIVAFYSSVLTGGLLVVLGSGAAAMSWHKQPAIRFNDAEAQIALAECIRGGTPAEKRMFIGIIKSKDAELSDIIEMLSK